MWPISHSHDLFCFHLHLCMVPSLGPPVPEQLEAGGIFKSLQPKHILSNVGGVVAGRGNHPASAFAQLYILNHWRKNCFVFKCIIFLDHKACQFLTHDCSHSLQASVRVDEATVGNATVSVRKIIMVIPWGDAFVSTGNSKNVSTVNLVLP